VNGDGFSDFLVTVTGFETGESSKVYLILGQDGGETALDPSAAVASFVHDLPGELVGYDLAAAGDLNGDGPADFYISVVIRTADGSEAIATYLIYGRAAADWGMDFSLSNADEQLVDDPLRD